MPAKKPPLQPTTPLSREQWVVEFQTEMERLRKLSIGKFLSALANQQWAAHQNEDPAKVAQDWVKRTGNDR